MTPAEFRQIADLAAMDWRAERDQLDAMRRNPKKYPIEGLSIKLARLNSTSARAVHILNMVAESPEAQAIITELLKSRGLTNGKV